MATLARHQYGVVAPFRVVKLEERNVRTGFFEEDAFAAVCRALRPELAALVTVAKLTGWRKSELRSRQWRHVDFKATGITSVIWASGFRYDFSWVQPPVLDEAGEPVQTRGVTRCPGLYFLGLRRMYTLNSAILSGVGKDAAHLAEHIAARG